jgi:lactoylglutathione lyase
MRTGGKEKDMKFTAIHTNITVADLERSVRFYEEAFGLQVVRRVNGADGVFNLVFLETEKGGHRLELTWFRDRVETHKAAPQEEEQGFIPHLAFMPEDFDEALQAHKEMGIVCLESPKRGVYFVKDPDGYWVEVVPRSRAF